MRKKVLFIGMLVTLLFAFSGCGTKNERVVTLIMSDVQEGDHPTAQACDKFAELVKKRTNGKVVIEVYHGSTLGTEAEQPLVELILSEYHHRWQHIMMISRRFRHCICIAVKTICGRCWTEKSETNF